MRGQGLSLSSTPRRRDWSPRLVPEVAAGYYWHPRLDTNLGAASFRAVEGNGKTAANGQQATVANQPILLTENSSLQYRHADAGDGNADTILVPALQAGWTGTTYLGMWLRMGEATPTSGTTTVFAHQLVAGDLRRVVLINNGTTELWTLTMSQDGTAGTAQTVSWDASADYLDWIWLEAIFRAGVEAVLSVDFDERTPGAGGISLAALNNPSAPIGLGNAATGAANQNRLDRSLVVYCPGEPSRDDRVRMRNWYPPVGADWTLLAA